MTTYTIALMLCKNDERTSTFTITQHLRQADNVNDAIVDSMREALKMKPGFAVATTLWMTCDGDKAGEGGSM